MNRQFHTASYLYGNCTWALLIRVSHVEEGDTCPSSSATAATHSVHVTVDLHCRAIGTPDPVVARGTAGGECTAGGCRAGLCREQLAWCSSSSTQQVSDVLSYFVFFTHSYLIRRADLSRGVDHSCWENKGEWEVVHLAGRQRGQSQGGYNHEQHFSCIANFCSYRPASSMCVSVAKHIYLQCPTTFHMPQ